MEEKLKKKCESCLGTGNRLYDQVDKYGKKTGWKLDYEEGKSCLKCNGTGYISDNSNR